jgi:hypothetical protein
MTRHVARTSDGNVEVWGVIPKAIVRRSDGARFAILGVRRRRGRCWLYGGTQAGESREFNVGDEFFDPADMAVDHVPGHAVVFPDFETEILAKKHSAHPVKTVGHRPTTREELIASGLFFVDPESKLLVSDRSFRDAWEDAPGGIRVNMTKARVIQRARLERSGPITPALDALIAKAATPEELRAVANNVAIRP